MSKSISRKPFHNSLRKPIRIFLLSKSPVLGLSSFILVGACLMHAVDAAELGDVEIHGFASFGYIQTTENNYWGNTEDGSFEFNEFAVNFRADVAEKTSVGIQFFSRDLGKIGNNEIVLDWGFVDYRWKDTLSVRVGRVKTPSTLYNEYQDIDAVRTTILMPQGVYNLGYRDSTVAIDGINLYGNLDASSSLGGFEYSVYYGVVNIPSNGSVSKIIGTDEIDSDMDFTYGGNIIWNTGLEGLRVAGSFSYGKDWTISGDIVTFVPDLLGPGLGVNIVTPLNMNTSSFISKSVAVEYTVNDWVFVAEYLARDGTFADVNTGATMFAVAWSTWYVQADYRLNEQWSCAAYYTDYIDNRHDSDGSELSDPLTGWQNETVFAGRYDVNEAWNIKAEVHFVTGAALLDEADNPNGYSESWTLFALKSTVSF